jgi:hypothetical protein
MAVGLLALRAGRPLPPRNIWLWQYATSRRDAGSIPYEVIGFFNSPNP